MQGSASISDRLTGWARLLFLYLSSAATLMAGAVAQLATITILARSLGVAEFGSLMAITAATNVGVQLCGLGANEAMVRRVSADRTSYADLLGYNLLMIVSTGVALTTVFTLALCLTMPQLSNSWTGVSALAALAFSNIVLYRWILLCEDIFMSHWRVAQANAVNLGFWLARAVAAAVACIALNVRSIEVWALWQSATNLIVALACAAAVRRFGAPRWRFLRDELRLGIHFTTPWFFFSARQNIDLLALHLVAPPAVVGAFAVTKRTVEMSMITLKSIHRLIYPKLAIAAQNGVPATTLLAIRLLGPAMTIAAATAAGVFVAAPWLPTLFGDEYASATATTQVLCWVALIIAAHTIAYEALGAASRHALRAHVFNVGSIAGALLTAGLTYSLLVPGALAGIFISEVFIGFVLWITLVAISGGSSVAQQLFPSLTLRLR